jgi:hypothetical protein
MVLEQSAAEPSPIRLRQMANNMATMLFELGQPRAALDILEPVLAWKVDSAVHPGDRARSELVAGQAWIELGRPDRAEPFPRRAVALLTKGSRPRHSHVAFAMNSLSLALVDSGRAGEAWEVNQQGLEILEGPRTTTTSPWSTGMVDCWPGNGLVMTQPA